MCQEPRRNSPSVTPLRPSSACIATAWLMQSSSQPRKVVGVDPVALVLGARRQQRLRPQQAADMLGPERRARRAAVGHFLLRLRLREHHHRTVERHQPGFHRQLRLHAASGKTIARANPLRVSRRAPLRRYWGDLHGQSGETIGMGSARRLFPLRARQGLHRHGRPSGQRLPDHRRVLGEAQRADRRVRRAGPVRVPARLRMVGQHRHGRRPQHLLPPRRPADPPLLAHPGRGPDLDRRDLHRATTCSARCKARMPS